MERRTFLTIATSGIFVPKYERWFKQLSGLIIPRPITATEILQQDNLLREGFRKDFFAAYYNHHYEFYTLVNKALVLEKDIYYDGKTGIKTTYQRT